MQCLRHINRSKSLSHSTNRKYTGLVLTATYDSTNDGTLKLSECARKFDEKVSSKLTNLANIAKIEKSRTFFGLHDDYPVVTLAIVDDGKQADSKLQSYDFSSRDFSAESVRSAIGSGVMGLKSLKGITKIEVDSSGNAKSAGEAANLAMYSYDFLKSKKNDEISLSQSVLTEVPSSCVNDWEKGSAAGKYQNFARFLMETPANYMTPALFVEHVKKKAEELGDKITVNVRSKDWIEEKKMFSFLSVSRGSCEPPFLLEIHYKNADTSPVCLVGKGVTFDTGGISIKPSKDMDKMRADMGGAACVASATIAAAALDLPVNLTTIIPLCENMPSSTATKPGDVVTAMNGKTIQIDNTDAEGRLILADALCYAETFNPAHIIDVATLTGAIAVALGGECVGAYSTCDNLWGVLEKSGVISGDRFWRMPLFKEYGDLLKSPTADLNNISGGPYGGSITAAKFLQNFVTGKSWAHLDIAGVMDDTTSMSYLCKGMSGRPTRALIEALKLLAKDNKV